MQNTLGLEQKIADLRHQNLELMDECERLKAKNEELRSKLQVMAEHIARQNGAIR